MVFSKRVVVTMLIMTTFTGEAGKSQQRGYSFKRRVNYLSLGFVRKSFKEIRKLKNNNRELFSALGTVLKLQEMDSEMIKFFKVLDTDGHKRISILEKCNSAVVIQVSKLEKQFAQLESKLNNN